MDQELVENLRKVGIPYINDIPWGTHICSFFGSKSDLLGIVVPYFKAGLENNEFCIWVVSEPLDVSEAREALEAAIPDFQSYTEQIELYNHRDWYQVSELDADRIVQAWITKLKAAISNGYEGIRVCGSTVWTDFRSWKKYLDYEAKVENIIGSLQTIALCPFQLEKCGLPELLGLVQNHDFTFISCKDPFSYLNSMVNTDRFELIGKMAASVAHEIRNPMTSVKGFIQLLQGDKDLQKYSSYFMLMIDELERANDIITEYLSIAKPRVRNVENHNLNEILTTMLPLLQADARKEDKDVVLVTGDTSDILVDPREIRQVILNMVRNGLDSMPSGGVVKIRTSMHNNKIILEIEDSGHGIPEEIQVHLGKPFVTTKEHGTGLGMYVTYNILKSYQANINIRSSNEGTRFIIRFPSAEGGNSDYICRYKSG